MKLKTITLTGLLLILILTNSKHLMAQHHGENLVQRDYSLYHFGFILSFNQMNFSLKTNEDAFGKTYSTDDYYELQRMDSVVLMGINNQAVYGFTVGIVSNLKISQLLDLRFIPSLAFGERKLNYRFGAVSMVDSLGFDVQKSIQSTHIDLPLYVKFKSKRAHNVRAYVLGGIKFTYDLASNSKKNKDENEDYLRLNTNDLLLETGVGFDFYLPYFKFGIELKMSYGFNNLLGTENNIYTEGIESIKSKLFQISFTFE